MPEPNPKIQLVIHPWRCSKCRKEFPHMHIINVAGVDNLMIGTAKIFRIEVVCTHCGTVNYWNQREIEMARQTEAFLKLLATLHGAPIEPEK